MKIYDVEKTPAKLYYCGSPPLIMTDELSNLLTIWSNNRDKKGV